MWKVRYLSFGKLFKTYCALGPTLAASMIYMCIFQLNDKKHAEHRALFAKWGNGCDTSHSRAFRLWVWLVEV